MATMTNTDDLTIDVEADIDDSVGYVGVDAGNDIGNDFGNNGGKYDVANWGGEKVIVSNEQRDLLLDVFIEIQDYLKSESITIGDAGWDLFEFTEFMTGIERE
jgi:hypothetical protein